MEGEGTSVFSFSPSSTPNLVLTHPTVSAATCLCMLRHCACCGTLLGFPRHYPSRVAHPSEGHQIDAEDTHLSWRNHPNQPNSSPLLKQSAESGEYISSVIHEIIDAVFACYFIQKFTGYAFLDRWYLRYWRASRSSVDRTVDVVLSLWHVVVGSPVTRGHLYFPG